MNEGKASKWNSLKNLIFSKKKLLFLSNVTNKDIGVFSKEYNAEAKTLSIKAFKDETLVGFNKQILLKKPLDQSSSSEYINELEKEIIDNTGNIDIWPCEELLSLYIANNINLFDDKSVLELGSGYSGLAALILYYLGRSRKISVTDGNTKSIEHFQNVIIKENEITSTSNHTLDSFVLLWDRLIKVKEESKYDFIIISDCLFFVKYHIDLAITIREYLKKDGKCIIITPKRGNTMIDFIKEAEKEGLTIYTLIMEDKITDVFPHMKNEKYSVNLLILTVK